MITRIECSVCGDMIETSASTISCPFVCSACIDNANTFKSAVSEIEKSNTDVVTSTTPDTFPVPVYHDYIGASPSVVVPRPCSCGNGVDDDNDGDCSSCAPRTALGRTTCGGASLLNVVPRFAPQKVSYSAIKKLIWSPEFLKEEVVTPAVIAPIIDGRPVVSEYQDFAGIDSCSTATLENTSLLIEDLQKQLESERALTETLEQRNTRQYNSIGELQREVAELKADKINLIDSVERAVEINDTIAKQIDEAETFECMSHTSLARALRTIYGQKIAIKALWDENKILKTQKSKQEAHTQYWKSHSGYWSERYFKLLTTSKPWYKRIFGN